MKMTSIGRSLTLRLALLYALSTLLILLGVSWYMIQVIDRHFIEQDLSEMRGKLELASRLVLKARSTATLDQLPRHLDDALVGHGHLSLAFYEATSQSYAFGEVDYPAALLGNASVSLRDTPLRHWEGHHGELRGLALRLPQDASNPDGVIAVAIDTLHHREFIANFKLALGVVLGLAAVMALALGWAVARAGLRPLHQMADLAREITAERLTSRLPAERMPPELEDMASSFNAMLDRLRDSFERLSGFAADLAHEMRTPVSNLMMQSQVMLSQARSAEEYREVLASSLEEYERLARTIADMLFLAKADNGLIVPNREEVDLAQEIAGLFEFYEALAEDRGLNLQCAGEARVQGDRLMLRRALSNLVSNAIRYAPAGSTIQLGLAEAGGQLGVWVENSCIGLAAAELPRLFDRFYRADPARRETGDGAGLGLAITRSIARAHGGDIQALLQHDRIRFELHLPLPRT